MLRHRSLKLGIAVAAIALATGPALASASFASGRPTTPAPASPAGVSLVSGNRSLAVAWTETSTGSITFTATAKSAGQSTRSCSSHTLNCNIAALVNGVVYDVTVVAKNTGGTSAPSADATSIVGVPGRPLSVHAAGSSAAVTVKWAPPVASGVTNVTSYMATANPGGFSCSSSGTVLAPPARTCVISGLSAATKYTVTVTATNAYGTGLPSKPVSVSTN